MVSDDAVAYIQSHLEKIEVSESGWEVSYICPDTGFRRLKDNLSGEEHGGGVARLRRLPLPD